jgi:predicted MPP superfamily phosphohydrolase
VPSVFALIVVAYVGIQVYAISAAQAGLGLAPSAAVGLVAWVALMTALPFLIWRLERRGWHRSVEVAAWIGYSWMGFVFLFFWIGLGLDTLGWVVATAGAREAGMAGYLAAPRSTFFLNAALTLALVAYGAASARRPRVEKVALVSDKLRPGDAVRIVQISDVHLGVLVGRRRLRTILNRVRRLQPDVLVSTGDLVDGQADRLRGLAPLIAHVDAPLGKFAITGNHEYFQGIEHALDFHRRAGFTVLRGTAVPVNDAITIAGVDDPTGARLGYPAHTDEQTVLAAVPSDRFVVLLKHQPLVTPEARFDLQLSGHTHKGQIFPFALLVRLRYAALAGLARVGAKQWLYVSRGTGTWGPPIRVAAPPEITVIELQAADPA